MESPLDALVADLVNKLDTNQREEFEERAGIMEFDAKLPRPYAECLALLNVLHRHLRSHRLTLRGRVGAENLET